MNTHISNIFTVEPAMKRRRCQVARCKDNKTRESCVKCKKAVCGACIARVMTRNICVECDSDDEDMTYSLNE